MISQKKIKERPRTTKSWTWTFLRHLGSQKQGQALIPTIQGQQDLGLVRSHWLLSALGPHFCIFLLEVFWIPFLVPKKTVDKLNIGKLIYIMGNFILTVLHFGFSICDPDGKTMVSIQHHFGVLLVTGRLKLASGVCWNSRCTHCHNMHRTYCVYICFYFPTCQVRVVRFYVCCPSFLLPLLLLLPRCRPLRQMSPDAKRDLQSAVGNAGPQ